MYEKIRRWYQQKLWTAQMVAMAAEKGVLSEAQAQEIIQEEGT